MAWAGEPRKHAAAALKAWKVRRAKYGKTGRRPSRSVVKAGKVQTVKG